MEKRTSDGKGEKWGEYLKEGSGAGCRGMSAVGLCHDSQHNYLVQGGSKQVFIFFICYNNLTVSNGFFHLCY